VTQSHLVTNTRFSTPAFQEALKFPVSFLSSNFNAQKGLNLTITLIDVAVLFGMMQGLIVGLVILFSRFFKSEANQYLWL
jgi:hypothetical protein